MKGPFIVKKGSVQIIVKTDLKGGIGIKWGFPFRRAGSKRRKESGAKALYASGEAPRRRDDVRSGAERREGARGAEGGAERREGARGAEGGAARR